MIDYCQYNAHFYYKNQIDIFITIYAIILIFNILQIYYVNFKIDYYHSYSLKFISLPTRF